MIFILDNYDSFTYNLVQYIGEFAEDIEVVRNDRISVTEVLALNPDRIIISPGPCTPKEAGISVELVKSVPDTIPLLGVCLGHQSIAAAFGGKVVRAPYIMHGKVSDIYFEKSPIFKGLEQPFTATRYHSLVAEPESLPSELRVIARTQDNIIMGVEHKTRPIFGLQFHPESILTVKGKKILQNFINMGDQA